MRDSKAPVGQHTSDQIVVHRESQTYKDGDDLSRKITSAATSQRVAICTVGEWFGGVERHVLGMLTILQARGINTLLILFHNTELAAQARDLGVELAILPRRNRSLLATAKHLANILERRDIRIVHVHGYKAMVFCAIARLWHRFELIKTEHGLPEKTAGNPLQALRSHLYYLFDATATRFSNATVCCVTNDLIAQYRCASKRPIRMIPNGISSMDRHALPRPPEFRPGCFNLATVGRLEPVKSVHVAIDALCTHGMPQDVHLYVVGTGPCEADLRKRAETSGVAGRVHFLGFRRDACSFIAHCDVLVMPSLHEGLPYTLLEAMAFATPVVASRVGGLAEVIEDQVTGLLVAPNDVAVLASAIRRLIAEPALRVRLGEQSQRLQRANYTLEAMADSYLQIYREVYVTNA
jgi:L-malate glycosyltransferase